MSGGWTERLVAVGVTLLASAAVADDDIRLSFAVGEDRLEVTAAGLATARDDTADPPRLVVQLGPAPTVSLLRLTEAHVGARMSVSVCGASVMEAQITGPIDSGRVVFAGDFVDGLEARLTGATPCP